jgi:outer membrane protein TolC
MKKLFLIPLFAFALIANAQNSTDKPQTNQSNKSFVFSLDQAISHALTYNYSVINAGRDIEASFEKKWETTAAGLPQINAGVDFANNFVIQKVGIPADVFGGPAGTIVPAAFGTKYNTIARSTLSQLIFDGSYIVALQASKTYLKYYQNAKVKTDIEIKEAVINSYGNVLLVEESIAILEKNKASLEKTLSETKATFQNGLIEEESVEQLQITLTSINSTLNYNKRLVEVAYKMLKITLGIDINDGLKLTDTLDKLTVSNLDLALSKSEFSVNDNVNFQMALNFQEQRELELKLQKAKALPSLAANLNFGFNTFSNQFQLFSPNQVWYNFSNIGVGLNIPIFSSLARSSRTQQAKIALDQAKTQLSEAEQKLKLQYAAAKSDYEFSIEEYATAKSNLNLAQRIEKKQQIKFTEGLSTSFDYNDAQRQLYTNQQKYLQSMVDVINKKAALEKIINKQ